MDTTPVTLEGTIVRLVPLDLEQHFDDLLAVALDPPLWRWTWTRINGADDLRAYLATAMKERDAGTAMPFVTTLKRTGQVIGSTRFANIAVNDRRLEIGWTWIGTPWQRSGTNTDAKLIQLTHAFEVMGCHRVEFKTDALNEKSRNAMERIGCTFEGIFRKHGRATGGRIRDTAWYSIIDDEWPRVKRHIELLRERGGVAK